MKILLTGANGFLGWHTRLRLHSQGRHEVVAVSRENWGQLNTLIRDVDAVVHVAGVNRGPDDDQVFQDNVTLAEELTNALRHAERVQRLVFANSIQAEGDSPYGRGKAQAFQMMSEAAAAGGATTCDVRLPNLFGEHGRPHYNSFVATFTDAVWKGAAPQVNDRAVNLLHVQQAAQTLIDAVTTNSQRVDPPGEAVAVSQVLNLLREFALDYGVGTIPDISTQLRTDLFNTFRAHTFPALGNFGLTARSDPRGSFFEMTRSRAGQGQSSFSTTVPGVTRGDHYHLRKIERFIVVRGAARISLRRMFTNNIVSFDVTGESPRAIDMPIGWTHNITNIGHDELLTNFWISEVFEPADPDTFPEPVGYSTPAELETC